MEPQHLKNLSCLQCRRRKIRCDRENPCNPCTIRGQAASCRQVTQSTMAASLAGDDPGPKAVEVIRSPENASEPPSKRRKASRDLDELPRASGSLAMRRIEHRFDRLERILLQDVAPKQSTSASGDAHLRASRPENQPDDDSDADAHEDNEIQELLEDLAMGHRLKRRHLRRPPRTVDSGTNLSDQESFDEENPLDHRSSIPAIDVAYEFLELCPRGDSARLLLDFYFAHIDWCTRVLHPDTDYASFVRLADLAPYEAATRAPTGLLCCYLAVLALSLHFAGKSQLGQLGFTGKTASRLADTLCAGSQQLLWSSNFLRTRQLSHLACVNLLGVYQHNRRDQADAYWALLGAAIKVAQNLGLSRIDAPASSDSDQGSKASPNSDFRATASPSSSPVQQELGRRIWWNLVWMDWSQAAAHYGTYSIHPAHNHTDPPRNVDIVGPQVSSLQPASVYTQSSANIMRMKYVEVYRQITDHRNERGSLSSLDVLAFSDAIDKIHDSTPPHLQISHHQPTTSEEQDPPHRSMEKIMLELMYHNRHLRLHRDRQMSGYTETRWDFTRRKTVYSAKKIIQILERGRRRAKAQVTSGDFVLLRFWLVTLYLLGAATALILELLFAEDLDNDRQDVEEHVEISIYLLSQVGECSESARSSRRVLKDLFRDRELIRTIRKEHFMAQEGSGKTSAVEPAARLQNMQIFVDIVQKAFSDRHHQTSRRKQRGTSTRPEQISQDLQAPPDSSYGDPVLPIPSDVIDPFTMAFDAVPHSQESHASMPLVDFRPSWDQTQVQQQQQELAQRGQGAQSYTPSIGVLEPGADTDARQSWSTTDREALMQLFLGDSKAQGWIA